MKKGFTLTEVLITLVVLGALALILIPNFSKMIPDDNVVKYQKAFYTLQEIVNDMVNDENTCQAESFTYTFQNKDDEGNPVGDPEERTFTEDDIFNEPLKNCKNGSTTRNLRTEICERLSTVAGTSCTDGSVKQTTNGMQFYIPSKNLDTSFTEQKIVVALNPSSTITKDSDRDKDEGIFIIKINPSGKVIPDNDDDGALLKKKATDD